MGKGGDVRTLRRPGFGWYGTEPRVVADKGSLHVVWSSSTQL